jgi:hypothetical protein
LELGLKVISVIPLSKLVLRLCCVLPLLLLSSCILFASEDDFGKSWKDHSREELKKAWGEPTESKLLEDGRTEVQYGAPGEDCIYYFIVQRDGKIVDYRYDSRAFWACKPNG